jgi:hypothetical protein
MAEKKPTKEAMRVMLSNISTLLREGRIRQAQGEARKLYDALYRLGLLPELSE